MKERIARLTRALDDWQRAHAVAGFPIAVVRKYGDDEGGRHAALMTYYGFLSVIPLLLLLVVIATRILAGNPELRARFLEAVVPPQLREQVESGLLNLPAEGLAFWVGIIGLVGTGVGIVFTAHDTLNHVAGVPQRLRLRGPKRYLRALAMLVVLLVGVAVIGGLSAQIAGLGQVDAPARAVEYAGIVGVLFLLAWAATILLLPTPPSLRAVWPMALLGAVVVAAFLAFAALLLPRLIARAGPVYGGFATIIGLFTFISLISQALVYASEVAVVRRHRLWPRSLDPERPTRADALAMALLAREQERMPGQRISSTFE